MFGKLSFLLAFSITAKNFFLMARILSSGRLFSEEISFVKENFFPWQKLLCMGFILTCDRRSTQQTDQSFNSLEIPSNDCQQFVDAIVWISAPDWSKTVSNFENVVQSPFEFGL